MEKKTWIKPALTSLDVTRTLGGTAAALIETYDCYIIDVDNRS